MATILCRTHYGVVLTLASKYELDRTIRYWVIAIFITYFYVTLWPWPLTYFPQNWETWPESRDDYMCIYWSL